MCLSDGMGSGMEACKESETVVELSGTVYGIRLFTGNCGEDGEQCSGIERAGKECFPPWISVR